MTPSVLQCRLDLACEPSAVHFARSHTQDVLQKWQMPEEVSFDAETVVCELVTNAVRHAGQAAIPFKKDGGQPPVPQCALTLWVANTRLHIGVWDQSAKRPVLRPPSAEAESGRGLLLVAGLTEGQWGVAGVAPEGKIVWAALPLPASYRRRLALGWLSRGASEAVSA
ncbi:ATP-binding protein [Actinacidiphila sp. bgisy145]|uniref:ATP-binding protein n=1 Tax=Actinacidiphila sp. bgisy145 TaxID=3413792 RepID=UPI003EB79592